MIKATKIVSFGKFFPNWESLYCNKRLKKFCVIELGAVIPLPDEKKIVFKWKTFADDKLNVTQNIKFVLGKIRVQNILGKGENAFSSFTKILSKGFFPWGCKNSLLFDIGLNLMQANLMY